MIELTRNHAHRTASHRYARCSELRLEAYINGEGLFSHDISHSGYGTNLEGPFPLVCEAIERCHEAVSTIPRPRESRCARS